MNKAIKIVLSIIWIISTMLGIFANILFTNDLSNPLPIISMGQAIVIITLICIFRIKEPERFIFYISLMFLLPGILMFQFGIVLFVNEKYLKIMELLIFINTFIFTCLYIIIIEKMIRSQNKKKKK